MSHPMRDTLVGLTVIAGLLGVAVLLMMFGEFSLAQRDKYPVYVELQHASGLTTASVVTLNGVRIGEVRSMRNAEDPHDGVVLTLMLGKGARVPRDVRVVLERGLVGEATLALSTVERGGEPRPGFVGEGETLRAEALDIFDVMAEMIDRRLAAFTDAASAFREMSGEISELGRSAQRLLEPLSPEEVDAGAAPNLASTLARLDGAVADARGWLSDDALRTDFRSAVRRANTLLDETSATLEAWTKAATRLTERADELGDEAREALRAFAVSTRALGEAMLEVQTLVAGINRGEGTAGQLVKNPDLYRSLNDASQRLEKALEEAQLLIEKFRREGVPVQF